MYVSMPYLHDPIVDLIIRGLKQTASALSASDPSGNHGTSLKTLSYRNCCTLPKCLRNELAVLVVTSLTPYTVECS